jgi:putative ATP-binding cassette transporter
MTIPEAHDDATFEAEGDFNTKDVKKASIDDLPENIQIAEAEQALDAAAQGDHEKLRKKYLLRRFWHTAKGFWSRQRGDRLAWLLSFSLIVLILVNLAAMYGINLWNRAIFDALEKREADKVFYLSAIFLPLAAASVLFGVTNVWTRMTTQRRWRAWVSDAVISRWLKNGRYYQLNLVSGDHQNPEGRLTEDLRVSTDAPIDFAVGVLQAALSAITFIAVLWTIGGALTLSVGGTTLTIPGFLVIAAVAYAVLASGAMTAVGSKFVSVSEARNQAEADYRYQLTRVRENGESIALLGGEEEERAGIDRSLATVLRRWRELCHQHMKTTIVSQGSSLIAPVIPLILCAPKFLDGSMSAR